MLTLSNKLNNLFLITLCCICGMFVFRFCKENQTQPKNCHYSTRIRVRFGLHLYSKCTVFKSDLHIFGKGGIKRFFSWYKTILYYARTNYYYIIYVRIYYTPCRHSWLLYWVAYAEGTKRVKPPNWTLLYLDFKNEIKKKINNFDFYWF